MHDVCFMTKWKWFHNRKHSHRHKQERITISTDINVHVKHTLRLWWKYNIETQSVSREI